MNRRGFFSGLLAMPAAATTVAAATERAAAGGLGETGLSPFITAARQGAQVNITLNGFITRSDMEKLLVDTDAAVNAGGGRAP